MREPEMQAQIDAALAAARAGEAPEVPEHVPEPEGAMLPGLTYCMRCGLLLAGDRRPDLDPDRKPCRIVKISLRTGGMFR